MKQFCLILISLVFIVNCSDNKEETHILDFKKFTIEVPHNWKKIENLHGVDSFVGGFVTEDGDSIRFDLGMYSNSLQYDGPSIIPREAYEFISDNSGFDSTNYVVLEDTYKLDTDIYRKRNLKWDTINGYLTKIVFPVRSGDGVTGIYIDSLYSNGFSNIKFNLCGFDLKPEDEKLFLEAIQTIKFKLN